MSALLLQCLNLKTMEDFLACARLYLAQRNIKFQYHPLNSSSACQMDWSVPTTIPQIILVNHSYELVMIQSYLNLVVVQKNTKLSKMVLVCESSYRDMAPPPMSHILDTVLIGHIRIDRRWERAKKAHELYTGILSALRKGHTVVLFGDVDTLTTRNPLRQLYRTVLDRLPMIPKRVFHVWPYAVQYPFRDIEIAYTCSPIIWKTEDLIVFRTHVDDRWTHKICRI
jgi:hypothetical protein